MTKRILYLLCFFLCMSLSLMAQGIVVSDFRLAETDLTANTHGTMVYDQNGEKCALIKVETTQRGFSFDVGMLGIMKVEEKIGEIWVYVPAGVKRLTIQHQQLGTLRDHDLGQQVQKGRTYILKLTTGTVQTVVQQKVMSQFLVFEVEPSDAIVRVNGDPWIVEEGYAQRFVSFGSYSYTVEAPDYHPSSGSVTVDNPDQKTQLKVSLKPAFGWIEVMGDATSMGAQVYIDNKPVGQIPLKSGRLASGSHRVMVVKDMYRSYEQTIEVTDNATATCTPSLIANFAEVRLTTDSAAEIWLNGERKGVGTWSGRLVSGEYLMETRRENHRPQSKVQRFESAAGVQHVELDAPTPIYGGLSIAVTPGNAEVFMDGVSVGNTPLFLQRVLIGRHALTLKKQGYGDFRTEVDVTEGQVATVEGKMNNAVMVQFTSNVPTVMLKVDGVEVGSSQGSYSLSYGRHRLEMSAEGYQPFAQEIEVSDAARSFSLTMKKSPLKNKTYTVNGVSFTMIAVNGGTFQMGATKEQKYRDSSETPIHQVTLSDYYIGETEVTQALWKAVMGNNPSKRIGDNLPVDHVPWDDCKTFIKKLNQLTGAKFSLPTEAQWEFAARGGNKSRGYQYSGSINVGDVAWYCDNSGGKLHAVKTKRPNELGIYDMSGNVWEWCQDKYGDYSSEAQTDPKGPASGSYRVFRGGCWAQFARDTRVSARSHYEPGMNDGIFGFRLAHLSPNLESKVAVPSLSQSAFDTEKGQNKTENKTFTVNGVSFSMVAVKGGTFPMGATKEQQSPNRDEMPVHQVTLSDYYIGETEVTQALWKAVMGSNPSNWKGDNLPVEQVSWNACQTFIKKLSQLTGIQFSLPTEAQWEYAARGGNQSRGYQYSGSNHLDDVAWYGSNSGSKTHAVKTKQPNELGLYDMSGNVLEWCQDGWGSYSSGAQTDPQGPSTGSDRVSRGGCWSYFAGCSRVSYRAPHYPDYRCSYLGLRLSVSSQK